VLLSVTLALLALIALKVVTEGMGPTTTASGDATASMTSVHNDAVDDFEAAVASGKPVYVLFHSLTCQPCVAISAVADRVMPDYENEVVFVNAITDDASGRDLASRFSFQLIPTSFFLSPGGTEVVDTFTGAMDDVLMREYLDALVAAE
jgi:thiol-disulfide isomerase/thioredoxin